MTGAICWSDCPSVVIGVAEREPDTPGLVVTVESPPAPRGCPQCGVIAAGRGRREVVLVDAPAFGRPVRIVWRTAPGAATNWAVSAGR